MALSKKERDEIKKNSGLSAAVSAQKNRESYVTQNYGNRPKSTYLGDKYTTQSQIDTERAAREAALAQFQTSNLGLSNMPKSATSIADRMNAGRMKKALFEAEQNNPTSKLGIATSNPTISAVKNISNGVGTTDVAKLAEEVAKKQVGNSVTKKNINIPKNPLNTEKTSDFASKVADVKNVGNSITPQKEDGSKYLNTSLLNKAPERNKFATVDNIGISEAEQMRNEAKSIYEKIPSEAKADLDKIYNSTSNLLLGNTRATNKAKADQAAKLLMDKYGMDESSANYYARNYDVIKDMSESGDMYNEFSAEFNNYDSDIQSLVSAYTENMVKYDNAPQAAKGMYYTQLNDAKAKLNELGWTDDQIDEAYKKYKVVYDTDQYNQQRKQIRSDINGSLGKTLMYNAADLATFIPSSIEGAFETVNQKLGNQYINPYASGYNGLNMANITEEATNERIGNDSLYNKARQFAYGVTMSTAKSGEALMVGSGVGEAAAALGLSEAATTTLVNASTLPMFGSSAYQSSLKEGIERGLGTEKASQYALMSGLNEMAFELISLDKAYDLYKNGGKALLENGYKQALKEMAAQGLIEGSEEGFTDIANWMADSIVNKDYSEYNQLVQKVGKAEANKQYAKELAMDVAAGTVSGAAMGGGALAASISNVSDAANVVMNTPGATDNLIKSASMMSPESKAAKVANSILENNREATKSEVMDIIASASGETSVQNAIKDALVENGYAEEEAIRSVENIANAVESGNTDSLNEQERREYANYAGGKYNSNEAADIINDTVNTSIEINDAIKYLKENEANSERMALNALKEQNVSKIKALEIEGKSTTFNDDQAAQIFKEYYRGQNVDAYTELATKAYEAGQVLQNVSATEYINQPSVKPYTAISDSNLELVYKMYERGQSVRQDNLVNDRQMSTFNGDANTLGKVDISSLSEESIQKYKPVIEIADKLAKVSNVAIKFTDDTFDSASGSLLSSMALVTVGLNTPNPMRTLVHETFGEFGKAYNPEGMNAFINTALEYAATLDNASLNKIVNSVKAYQEEYQKSGIESESDKTLASAGDEFVFDFMAGLMTSEENLKGLVSYIENNTHGKQKQTILDTIKQLFEDLINFLKGINDKNLGANVGKNYAKASQNKAQELIEMYQRVFEGAAENFNEKVKNGKTKSDTKSNTKSDKVAHSVEVPTSTEDSFTLENDGNVRLDPRGLSSSAWSKLAREFKKLGYDIKDGEHLKEVFTTNFNNLSNTKKLQGILLNPDQSNVAKKLFDIGAEAEETFMSFEEASEIAKKAEKEFGTTRKWELAGYLDVNGKLLDFSSGQGYRVQDHREISQVLDLPEDAEYSDGLIEFMNEGNIRLQSYGFDISRMYNATQKSMLREFINKLDGEVTVDISNLQGGTIGSIDYSEGTASSRILNDIANFFETGEVPQGTSDGYEYNYSVEVTKKDTLDFLDNQEHVEVYRAMQIIDGDLYPPMSAYYKDIDGKTKMREPSKIGKWYKSIERPDLIDAKTGKFKLDKGKTDSGKKGTVVPAAYNPYFHTSLSPLNDQFTSAYTRSNLVVVKGLVPKSELTSGYKAKYAKDSVGMTEWHSGVVAGQMEGVRKVILTRYFKPIEIMNDADVAVEVKKMLDGTNIEIPYNVVSPGLRRALENEGVTIGEGRGIRNLPPKDQVKYSVEIDLKREISKYGITTEWNNPGISKLIKKVLRDSGFFDKGYAINKQTGDVILISGRGIDETFGKKEIFKRISKKKKELKVAVISNLYNIIEDAKIQERDVPNIYDSSSDIIYDYYSSDVIIDGDPYVVKLGIRKTDNGNIFYFHFVDVIKKDSDLLSPSQNDGVFENQNPISDNITSFKEKSSHSIEVDSTGKKLSPQQKEYFKDSKVVDENGNLKVVYHGSYNKFTVFDKTKPSINGRVLGDGFYFAPTKENAKSWNGNGENVYKCYLNITNPYYASSDINTPSNVARIIKDKLGKIYDKYSKEGVFGRPWKNADMPRDEYVNSEFERLYSKSDSALGEIADLSGYDVDSMSDSEFYSLKAKLKTEVLKSLGYDGIIYTKGEKGFALYGGDQYVAFDPDQIKLTTNKKPTSDNDIRYSREVDDVWEEIMDETLSKPLSIVDQGAKLGGTSIDSKAVNKIAKNIIQANQSKYSSRELAKLLTNAFNYMEHNDTTYDAMLDVVHDIAMPVLEDSDHLNGVEKADYDKMREYLGKTKIALSDKQRQEVAKVYGSVSNYRDNMFGYAAFSNSGTTLDECWNEIVKASGNRLDVNVAEGDMPILLEELMHSLKPGASNDYGMDLEHAAYEVAFDIFKQYYAAVNDAKASASFNKARQQFKKDVSEKYRKEYAKALAEAKRKHVSDIQALKNEIEAIKTEAAKPWDDEITKLQYESEIKRLNDRIELIKKQNDDKIAKVKAKNAASKENASRRKKNTDLKHQLKNSVNSLQKMLKSPNVNDHIKMTLVRPTIDVLEAINLDTGKSKLMAEKLEKLQKVYDAYKSDTTFEVDYDESTANMIEELKNTFDKRNYTDLSNDELSRVLDLVKRLKKQIQNANKILQNEKLHDAYEGARDIILEVESGKGVKNDKVSRTLNRVANEHLNAYREFRKLANYKDGALMALYDQLDKGQLKKIETTREIMQIFSDVLEGKENQKEAKRLSSTKKEDLVDIGLKDDKGNPILVTRGMRLSLIMHSRNDSNMAHVLGGGFTVPNLKEYYDGKQAEAYADGDTYRYVPRNTYIQSYKSNNPAMLDAEKAKYSSDIQALYNELSDWEKRFLKDAETMFYDVSGKKVNEVSNVLKGYSLARVKNYFPIKTDKNFTRNEITGLMMDGTIEGRGSWKSRVNATNPIYLEDITKVILRHANDVSDYVGLAIPIRNFNMLFNVQTYDKNGKAKNIRKSIEDTYSINDLNYVTDVISQLQSGGKKEDSIFADLFNGMRSKFAGAVLTANVGVAMKQAASFPTAAAVVGWTPLAKALVTFEPGKANVDGKYAIRTGIKELEEINPLLWYRNQGNSTEELGDLKKRGITDKMPTALKAVSVDLIQNVDTATVRALEYASMYYVDDNFKNLKKGSEEYWQKVSDTFTKVVEETQPNYTVLQRAKILRTENALLKQVFMFKTQPMQNFGIVYDALGELRAKGRQYKANKSAEAKAEFSAAQKNFAKAISSQVVAATVFSAMTILSNFVYHKWWKYDQDDEKTMGEELRDALANGILSTLSGAILLGDTVYNTVYSMVTGNKNYGLEISTVELINDINEEITNFKTYGAKLWDADTTEKKMKAAVNLRNTLDDFAQTTAQFVGIPYNNIKNSIESVMMYSMDFATDAKLGESDVVKYRSASDVPSQKTMMVDAFFNNEELYKTLRKEYVKASTAADPEASANNVINARLKEMYEANQITLDEYEAYLKKLGLDDDKIQNKIKNIVDAEYKNGEMSFDDYADELSQVGVSDEKITKKVVDNVKDNYLSGILGRTEARKELRAEGIAEDKIDEYLDKWDYAKSHNGSTDGYSKYYKLEDALAKGNVSDVLIKEYQGKGIENKAIKSKVTEWYHEYVKAHGKSANVQAMVLTVYQKLGYSRTDELDTLNKWYKKNNIK